VIAILVHYSGHVQGVGFRATAARVARSHGVTGWVKNLPDGRVALWAEGDPDDVQAFLEALRSRMSRCIGNEERQPQEAAGRFTSFDVTH
jgi:acylphosphatase